MSSSPIITSTPGLGSAISRDENDSPFPSVYSDVTMEEEEGDGYFFSTGHASILEYSDDTTSDHDGLDHEGVKDESPKIRKSKLQQQQQQRHHGKSRSRMRRESSLLSEDGAVQRASSNNGGSSPQIGIVRFLDNLANQEAGDDDVEPLVHHYKHHKKQQNNPELQQQKGWMKRWTSSFRSPVASTSAKPHKRTHRRDNSSSMEEYPHFSNSEVSPTSTTRDQPQPQQPPPQQQRVPPKNGPPPRYDSTNHINNENNNIASSLHYYPHHHTEQSRLLNNTSPSTKHITMSTGSIESSSLYHPPSRSIVVAAALLQDYEAGRPPTFSSTSNVSDASIAMYHFRHSWTASIARMLATAAFFIASFMEGTSSTTLIDDDMGLQQHSYYQNHHHRYYLKIATGLNLFAIVVFAVDLWTRRDLWTNVSIQTPPDYYSHSSSSGQVQRHKRHQHRITQAASLVKPMALFCFLLGMENIVRIALVSSQQQTSHSSDDQMVLFSSIFKPLVLFYVSSQAREAFSAVRRILMIVLRVLLMELLLILMFASVACRLFNTYDGFGNLSSAWLSLFELATTVVNPSVWMPIYKDSRLSALFFVAFIVVTVFYLHSLVLSVVFQTYIQAAGEIHERNSSDREDAVHLAFQALCQNNADVKDDGELCTKDIEKRHVSIDDVRETLCLMRPHYNPMKINALVGIVDPSHQGMVDFISFRTKIRQALNASVRTARNASILAMSVELIAVTMAVVNFIYVLLVSSPFSESWFESIQLDIGCLITLMGAFELLIRFNPLRVHDFTPLTRINVAFDGSALLAAFISGIGVFMYFAGMPKALQYILIGRSLDMIRALRFFEIFRDVVRRTSDVVPALAGPVILVVSTLHVFVYVGMALWGGAIDVGTYDGLIHELYDLNNFNSYQEGMVTMFQVLVVNDWHAIAQVFQFASRCSSNYLVFPFFISANLFGVSVMLNVLTAFFVESFVTKLHNDVDAPAEDTTTVHNRKERDFSIQASARKLKRIASRNSQRKPDVSFDPGTDADSEGSSISEKFEFDVYEREGYDKIMQTVSSAQGLYDGDVARNICTYLEIFESLTPGREPVGYLICDQRTLERFGNRRFKSKSIGYLDENQLHGVVTDMHSELLALSTKADFDDKSLRRSFHHRRDPSKVLEISASLLRRQPALSLFVARTNHQTTGKAPPSSSAGRHHKR